MSLVHIHVGQAGIQVAGELWSAAAAGLTRSQASTKQRKKRRSRSRPKKRGVSAFFDDRYGLARAVLVDSEPKVLASLVEAAPGPLGPAVGFDSVGGDDGGDDSCDDTGCAGVVGGGTPPSLACFMEDNVFHEQRGRGNNWAMGYFGRDAGAGAELAENERSLTFGALEAVRREAEKCDMFQGSVVYHSTSGGTGSGTGARVVETLRDTYPARFIMTASVGPFRHGEAPLQHYNSCLSLAKMQECADCIMLFDNEELLHSIDPSTRGNKNSRTPRRMQPPRSGTGSAGSARSVSFQDINRCIAASLVELMGSYDVPNSDSRKRTKALLPAGVVVDSCDRLSPFDLGEFVTCVCPSQAYKFVQLWSTAGRPWLSQRSRSRVARDQWTGLSSTLTKSVVPRYREDGKRPRHLCYQVIARGDNDLSFHDEEAFLGVQECFHKNVLACDWNPFPGDFRSCPHPPPSCPPSSEQSRSMSVAVNGDRITDLLNYSLHRARAMFDAGAYLHWYRRYGCEDALISDAFETLDGVCLAYEELSRESNV